MWSRWRCDLQDITLVFGQDRGRFYDLKKRAIDNLNCCGPFIKTVMTRCIHCTRCVRFLNEISGNYQIGVIGRGKDMEIGTFIKSYLFNELSGNIVDLCPVGALTSMPYAFVARSWELIRVNSIDVMDAIAASIRVDVVNNKVVRILPRLDENVNEEWISNKARYIYDCLSIQRLYFPKLKINNKLFSINWIIALELFLNYINNLFLISLEAVCGNFVDLETVFSLKYFFNSIGCSNIFFIDYINYSVDFRFLYLLNTSLIALEDSNLIILIGCNLRLEAPLILTRIRKKILTARNKIEIYSFGLNNNYLPVKNFGNSLKNFKLFLEGKLLSSVDILFNKFNLLNKIIFNQIPIFFYGMSVITRFDFLCIVKSFLFILSFFFVFVNFYWKFFNIIFTNLGLLSCFELGFLTKSRKISFKSKLVYLINADILDYNENNFIIYQGYFYNSSYIYYKSNIILPAAVYLEKSTSYINLEGRYRFTKKAITPFTHIHLDSDIIQVLSSLRITKFVKNFSIVENFFEVLLNFINIINYECLFFSSINSFFFKLRKKFWFSEPFINFFEDTINIFKNIYSKHKFLNTIFCRFLHNYYNSNIFCKNSKIMSISSHKNLQFLTSFQFKI